ncbi:Uncharacterised protein [Citrobacter koseri]|uniref:Uncharacterized protein n=1 Tax=Citrobacter koseri TaxID=545 RepID=A0A2X2UYM1_CITKO|nr:Uncharacterised protein [Citrobacter koseri]
MWRGAAILWFVPQALVAQNGALLIGLLFGYTLCYMPTAGADQQHRLSLACQIKIKPSRLYACSARLAGLWPVFLSA